MSGDGGHINHTRARLERALLFVEEALTEQLTIERIARHAHLSPFHFQRLFMAHMGETVGGYVSSRRLEYAARRIRQAPDDKMIAIALDCGFETPSAFSRAFRRHFGCTPSQFRKDPERARRRQSPTRPFLLTPPPDRSGPQPALSSQPGCEFVFRTFRGTLDGSFFDGGPSISQEIRDGLIDEAGQRLTAVIGSFPDEPDRLNDSNVTGYFGGLTDKRYESSWGEGWRSFAAGRWAVFEHFGSYKFLYQNWNRIYRTWAATTDLTLRDAWPYEAYLPDPDFSGKSRPTALIHIPVI
ncbi:MAG: AraC family transcriptional regulator [Hyphomicrobiales bacterium]|nr:AraC family transcriptional regulator [Hyphomicrobiales bacterium]MCP4997815.1 AraC family transcriptional regulator [Hyphomicrobiales bacterium]